MSDHQKALLYTFLFFLTCGVIICYSPLAFLGLILLFGVVTIVFAVYNTILMIIEGL
jgi:hypothetical protein